MTSRIKEMTRKEETRRELKKKIKKNKINKTDDARKERSTQEPR